MASKQKHGNEQEEEKETFARSAQQLSSLFHPVSVSCSDSRLASLQSASVAASLPAEGIRVLVRSGRSSMTAIFTGALAQFSDEWAANFGVSTTPAWSTKLQYTRVETAMMAATVAATPYSIGYFGQNEAASLELPTAAILNRAGRPIQANTASVNGVMLERGSMLDERMNINLINAEAATACTDTAEEARKDTMRGERSRSPLCLCPSFSLFCLVVSQILLCT
jgi:hypothetical protein